MKSIPFTNGVYLSREEKAVIAEQLVKGVLAQREARRFQGVSSELVLSLERTAILAGALTEALTITLDALRDGSDADVAMDQAQAALVAAWRENYPDEPVPGL